MRIVCAYHALHSLYNQAHYHLQVCISVRAFTAVLKLVNILENTYGFSGSYARYT